MRRPVFQPLREFLQTEAAGGAALVAATVVALVWANVAQGSYADLWSHSLRLGVADAALRLDLQHWVNDGLMTVFFFVVGLEIKRELVTGELRDRRTATLPALAALGGMVVPALLFLVWNAGTPAQHGWAIPMATDIAFAVGVLTLLGSHVPPSLKLFVLTLAIVDDIGAIIVIAAFYSDGIAWSWLAGTAAALAGVVAMRRVANHPALYVLPALALWVCVHESGVHATLAGVALGLLTPTRARDGSAPIERLEHRLHPFASFLAVPVFALANAGMVLSGSGIRDALGSRVTWGIVTGLVVGKLVGVVGATALGVRLNAGRLPAGVTGRDVAGAGALAGIGFTVSLFVVDLSFRKDAALLADAKLAVLAASVVAALVAAVVFMLPVGRRPRPEPGPGDPARRMLRGAAGPEAGDARDTRSEVSGASAARRRP